MANSKENCLFCKIIKGEIKSNIKHEDETTLAFSDINPQAPVHILVVPKQHVSGLNDASDEMVAQCISAAKKIARDMQIAELGYRVVINCNGLGGQEVYHLHVHLLGGRQMKWPPG